MTIAPCTSTDSITIPVTSHNESGVTSFENIQRTHEMVLVIPISVTVSMIVLLLVVSIIIVAVLIHKLKRREQDFLNSGSPEIGTYCYNIIIILLSARLL